MTIPGEPNEKQFNYGEDHPRVADERMPMVLVILDGLGDRPLKELGGRTPADAATTPNLDLLVANGLSGWHLPFGWGRATSSELSHWSMFGLGAFEFPGRSFLEGLGHSLDFDLIDGTLYIALRTSAVRDGDIWITGRCRAEDRQDASDLFGEIIPIAKAYGFRALPIAARPGEALLTHDCPGGRVSDSDPFFEDLHPWLDVRPLNDVSHALAARVRGFLREARTSLGSSPCNSKRVQDGLPALDILTTKWSGGVLKPLSFEEKVGTRGGIVASTALYKGFAKYLGMDYRRAPAEVDLATDMANRVRLAHGLVAQECSFVHVHTKATDEAGHSKNPYLKREVLESIDEGLDLLIELSRSAIVAVTGDHATPSRDGVMHAGEPTPFLIAGPTVPSDSSRHFGELGATKGILGKLGAADILPLMSSYANRPAFRGHRFGAWDEQIVLPDRPPAFRMEADGIE